jgi:phenylalanyl-tRNA synthetase beta chain
LAGVKLEGKAIVELLQKMGLNSKLDGKSLVVEVDFTRSDILHACDIGEDLAIAYNFNSVVNQLPSSFTAGK